ncbi:MAG: response regulator transcription factor [Chloroflexi bacterium]|nr:response regulator transcription factor [Chloroflexota bacterium]
MSQIRVLVVDDQVLFREGIVNLLASQDDVTVIGEAGDGLDAIEKAYQLQPDLILMDVNMPRLGGLEATRRIKLELPEIKVVILTVSDADDDLFEAIKAGAIGYLLKNLKAQNLFDRLRGAMRGEAALTPLLAAKVLEEFARQRQRESQSKDSDEGLTDREREVLQLVIDGASNKDIANTLCIAESTVKRHLHNILEKLHLENRVQAAAYAVRKGLIEPPSQDGHVRPS